MAAVAIAAFFIILPLGLLSFEIARLYAAQKQLQNAVDASALSAMTGISDGSLNDRALQTIGLTLFQRNQVTSSALRTAILSTTVDTDKPKAGDSTYNLAIDHTKNQARASAAFGYLPAFANVLGLGPVVIRANALAGTKSVKGDIVIAVDISDSIKGGCGINNQPDGGSSKSWVVTRHANLKGTIPKYTYTTVTKAGPKGTAPVTVALKIHKSFSPTGLHVGGNFYHAIPDPAQVAWKSNSNQVYQKFAQKSLEEQVALLAESKQGHLNDLSDKSKFDPKNNVDKFKLGQTALAKYLPEIGDGTIPGGLDYRAAYEEAGLPFVHPLADEKRDIKTIVELIVKSNPEANIALVGFAPRAGGHFKNPGPSRPCHPAPQPNFPPEAGVFGSNYGFGESCLNKSAAEPFVKFTNNEDEIIKSASICTTFLGTNTTDALNVAHALLTENQRNLKGVPQACFLLTDGVPTVGGYVKAAKQFGKDGIPIIAIGYVHIGYSHGVGPRVCRKIAKNGGPGSKYIEAPYINSGPKGFTGKYDPNNTVALNKAFVGTPVLINE